MTSSDFKYSIQNNYIGNNTHKVLANINQYGSIYKIDDIAIRVVGNLNQLQQATTISLGISGSTGEFYNIPVNSSSSPVRVVDRQLVQLKDGTGAYYLYSILTINQRVVVSLPASTDYLTDVLIEPGIPSTAQILQDYSALVGTILDNRESEFIVYSDRLYAISGSKTNPTNLYSILNNTAVPAQVQDSNYTSTGWINGRYNGSKLTSVGNHGANPFLQGTFFEGAFFGKDVDDQYIAEIAPSDLTLGQYFFSGKLDSLQYTLEDIDAWAWGYTTETEIRLISKQSGPSPYKLIAPLSIGELFRSKRSNPPYAISAEIFEMIAPIGSQQYFPYKAYSITSDNATDLTMQVKRGYNNTPKDLVVTYASTVLRIVPTKVYSLLGNSAQSITQGKIRVKGTTDVIYLDNNGFVVSGSTTNYI